MFTQYSKKCVCAAPGQMTRLGLRDALDAAVRQCRCDAVQGLLEQSATLHGGQRPVAVVVATDMDRADIVELLLRHGSVQLDDALAAASRAYFEKKYGILRMLMAYIPLANE